MRFRIGAIIFLALGLAAFLYFKPWERPEPKPRFYDRLPEADIIGKTSVLELSEELMSTMYYYKIPFREFASPAVLLSQGKGLGLDVQSPVYFFGNKHPNSDRLKDWGALIMVSDSSKIREGLKRVDGIIQIKDSVAFDTRLYINPYTDLAMCYGDDWMLICSRSGVNRYVKYVTRAKQNTISPRWRWFLNDPSFEERNIVIQAIHNDLKKQGIESLMLSTSNDSTSLIVHAIINQEDSVSIALKENGPAFEPEEFTRHLVNAHLDISRLRNNREDPLYKLMQKAGTKISFPLDDFLLAWEGDVAFRQGGIQTIREKYIESELDENFNVTEVVKYKRIKIPGFSLYLSMNEHGGELMTKLFDKGILTTEENKVRLLYSPPMRIKNRDTSLLFHTSRYAPATYPEGIQEGIWTINYTPVRFSLDSVKAKALYGRVSFPLKKIVEQYVPENDD